MKVKMDQLVWVLLEQKKPLNEWLLYLGCKNFSSLPFLFANANL